MNRLALRHTVMMDAVRRLARILGLESHTRPQMKPAGRKDSEKRLDVHEASSPSPAGTDAQSAERSGSSDGGHQGSLKGVAPRGSGRENSALSNIITASAALLGALVGGAATFAGVVYQNHASANGQLVSNRKTLYANYDTTLRNLVGYARGTEIYIDSGYPRSTWKSEDNEFRKYANQFGNWQVQINILGSERVSYNSQIEAHDVFQLDLSLNALEFRVRYPRAPENELAPGKAASVAKVISNLAKCESTARQFEAYARSELDSG
jgi:hypothetical protein